MFNLVPVKKVFFFLFLSFLFKTGYAQTKKAREQFIKDSTYIMRVKLVRPQLRGDNRTVFLSGQPLNIRGFDAGVLLKEKLRLTLGYYSLNDDEIKFYTKTIDDVEYRRRLRLDYGSLNTEFIYKNTRFFSLGMPLEFGFGKNELEYINKETDKSESKASGFLIMADFGLSFTFKPIRWVGLKAILGYKKTVFNQVKDFRLDGAFTSIGLNVDIREIVKDVQMYRLKKRYRKNINSIETAVDLITD